MNRTCPPFAQCKYGDPALLQQKRQRKIVGYTVFIPIDFSFNILTLTRMISGLAIL